MLHRRRCVNPCIALQPQKIILITHKATPFAGRTSKVSTSEANRTPSTRSLTTLSLPDRPTQATPQVAYGDSHNDTLTTLIFLRQQSESPPHLLSAGTDGLITLFNTAEQDEDDAVITVLNMQSAVSHVLPVWQAPENQHPVCLKIEDDPSTGVCAISCDERLAFSSLSENSQANEMDRANFGYDIWAELDVDYAISLKEATLLGEGQQEGAVLCAGVNKPSNPLSMIEGESEESREPHVGIYYIKPLHPASISHDTDETKTKRVQDKAVARLSGAHGEEVVRDVWFDHSVSPQALFAMSHEGNAGGYPATEH